MPSENLPELWDISIEFLYDERYLQGLIHFFNERAVKTILDCSCGGGYPAIDLAKSGFDVTCTDGSAAMIKKFRENQKKSGLAIPSQTLDWGELSSIGKEFDAVLCRGNSLIYVDSWESGNSLNDIESVLSKIRAALTQMFAVTSKTGLLYVDFLLKKNTKMNLIK